MTGEQLRQAQRALNMTNDQLRKRLGVAETTLCNWKAGRIPVPTTVDLAMKYLQDKNKLGK
jgi:DNA-binding transcriptional regulator YiaG